MPSIHPWQITLFGTVLIPLIVVTILVVVWLKRDRS